MRDTFNFVQKMSGIATYTSYDLKMFDELFNPKRIQYFVLPFNVDNYKKYISNDDVKAVLGV